LKFNSTLIFLISGLVLGFAAGNFFASQNKSSISEKAPVCEASPEGSCAEFENLKSQLAGVTPDQIREYLKTQSADEKLKKADEILGKIVGALVASVGFRLEKEELSQFGQVATTAKDNQPPAQMAPGGSISVAKIANTIPLDKKAMAVIRIIDTEDDAKKLLNSFGTNYSQRIQSAGTLNRQQIGELSGHFEGGISYINQRRFDRTSLYFRGNLTEDKLEGEFQLEIFKGPVSWSRCRSAGALKKNFSSVGPSVYIECGEDYFELVYFPRVGQWMGNFLQMKKAVLTKTGDVVLRRVGGF